MDYTKVLSKIEHAKDALAKKLDAIKTDVTNVNNSVTNLPTTLDSKFSALTSKVDGVKTDVAGVGSKVDNVKSDVAKTAKSTEISKLTDEIKKSCFDPSKLQRKKIKISSTQKGKDAINISGKGSIYIVQSGNEDSSSSSNTLSVIVDETTIGDISANYGGSNRAGGGIYFYKTIISYSKGPYDNILTTVFGSHYPAWVYDFEGDEKEYQRNYCALLTREPIKFNSSFRVKVNLADGSSDLLVYYTLDE